ncbi:MAG TPA: phosphoenolpyruvate synthase, partial [Chromatiales bacterium]|nr:phosphoenolpyruvate synthase [Chromatiales bacterium]
MVIPTPLPSLRRLFAILMLALLSCAPALQAGTEPDQAEMARWISAMKEAPRGPFARIRWFCKDGAILPPEPYACSAHGGGRQHGEPNEQARLLQAAGYPVGTVLAALDPVEITSPQARNQLKGILLERWLIAADDGWVLRQARAYRGAFQIEDEIASAQAMLLELARRGAQGRDLLLLRQAALLLPRAFERATLAHIHDLSTSLAEQDPSFHPLRNKIHSQPDAGDAERVRAHALGVQRAEAGYAELAEAIDTLFGRRDLAGVMRQAATTMGRNPLAARLRDEAAVWENVMDPERRLASASGLLAELRESMAGLSPRQRIVALDLGIDLEAETFTAGLELLRGQPDAPPVRRLAWLGGIGDALYG